LARKLVWRPLVVVIEQGNPFPIAAADSNIARFGATDGYWQADCDQAMISNRRKRFRGCLIDAVDHDNHFDIDQSLRESAPYCPRDNLRPIACRNDNADNRIPIHRLQLHFSNANVQQLC
jgi:hypothetical protein